MHGLNSESRSLWNIIIIKVVNRERFSIFQINIIQFHGMVDMIRYLKRVLDHYIFNNNLK